MTLLKLPNRAQIKSEMRGFWFFILCVRVPSRRRSNKCVGGSRGWTSGQLRTLVIRSLLLPSNRGRVDFKMFDCGRDVASRRVKGTRQCTWRFILKRITLIIHPTTGVIDISVASNTWASWFGHLFISRIQMLKHLVAYEKSDRRKGVLMVPA